jgi:hypothetical protein
MQSWQQHAMPWGILMATSITLIPTARVNICGESSLIILGLIFNEVAYKL